MVNPLTVTEATGPLAVAPAPDPTIDLVGFGFDLSGSISLRSQTFKANNQGQQDHEAFLVKLAPAATANDFVAAFSPGAPPGPPPGQGLGGFQAIAAGGGGPFGYNFFQPGNYTFISMVEDPASGESHSALAMAYEFIVQ